jgi:hypothetical protein
MRLLGEPSSACIHCFHDQICFRSLVGVSHTKSEAEALHGCVCVCVCVYLEGGVLI